MTATSALSASNANPFPDRADAAEIRLPGSDRTYEVRDVLRGMGLRWDPATRAWHGRLISAQRAFLERTYGLAPRPVVPIEAFARAEVAPSPPRGPVPPRPVRPRVHEGARTRFESRVAFGAADEDDPAEEVPTSTRRFSLLETTSGLPDDSREEDERRETRHLRDLRARLKAARAALSAVPGGAEVLRGDWARAARFCARFGITEDQFRRGIPPLEVEGSESLGSGSETARDWHCEAKAKAAAVFRGSIESRASVQVERVRLLAIAAGDPAY